MLTSGYQEAMKHPQSAKKSPRKPQPEKVVRLTSSQGRKADFEKIVGLIEAARIEAFRAVNTRLIRLHWEIGHFISDKLTRAEWGEGVVEDLARHLQRTQPHLRGFTRRNLFRMRQFYETYRGSEIVSSLMTQLPWTHHLMILTKCELPAERLFYIKAAIREHWSVRRLETQIKGSLFQRAGSSRPIVSSVMTQLHPEGVSQFKDQYLLDFVEVDDSACERVLQQSLVGKIKAFLMELGGDFCFVGEYVRFSVGERDFEIDLLFFNRALNALVVVDLKTQRFEPEHMGKLSFCLEHVDRELRKPHENPAVGLLLCASKDEAVVEYSLHRSLSPTLVSEYRTALPEERHLHAKLREICGPKVALRARGRRRPRIPSKALASRRPKAQNRPTPKAR